MTTGIDVVTEDMRAHARELEGIASFGQEGVDAGRYIRVRGDAFGVICGFIGELLDPIQDAGLASAELGVTTITGSGRAVRNLAGLFDETDSMVGSALDSLREAW